MSEIDYEQAEALLGSHGDWSYRRWAREVIRAGLVDQKVLDQATEKSVAGLLSTRAKTLDEKGLPRIGVTARRDENGDRTVQLRLHWGLDDYQVNVATRRSLAVGNLTMAEKLADECEERFGVRPTLERMPNLRYDDSEEHATEAA